MELLLASSNRKKLLELQSLLSHLGVKVLLPQDVGGLPPVAEDQPTFGGNARKKARSAALACGCWALADDSGLEVQALAGAPGVLSARYAGAHGDDGANNQRLLRELAGLPGERRAARFVCALALATPTGQIDFETEAYAHGRILEAARGSNDFGYDPLFLFTEAGQTGAGRTFAELNLTEKSEISHRGRALRRLIEHLSLQLRA